MENKSSKSNTNKTDPKLHVSKKVAGGTTGAMLGAVVGGPVGAIIGGVIGTVIGNAAGKGELTTTAKKITKLAKVSKPKAPVKRSLRKATPRKAAPVVSKAKRSVKKTVPKARIAEKKSGASSKRSSSVKRNARKTKR